MNKINGLLRETDKRRTIRAWGFALLIIILMLAVCLAACDPPTPTTTPYPGLEAHQTEVAKLYLVETMVASVTPAAFPVPLR